MIEVERKFFLDDGAKSRLIEGAEFVKERVFTDVYFDTKDCALTKKDWWLRFRDDKPELKIPLHKGPDRLADQYEELEEEGRIRDALGLSEGDLRRVLEEAGYEPFCVCKTTRRKYRKGPFTIDLDEVAYQDWGYRLGEIECMVEAASDIEATVENIIRFVQENQLSDTPVRGKVLEYLYRKRPDHYRALVEAGVVRDA